MEPAWGVPRSGHLLFEMAWAASIALGVDRAAKESLDGGPLTVTGVILLRKDSFQVFAPITGSRLASGARRFGTGLASRFVLDPREERSSFLGDDFLGDQIAAGLRSVDPSQDDALLRGIQVHQAALL